MYHIFLSLILIASQNQINQAQRYLLQQKNNQNKTAQTSPSKIPPSKSEQNIITQLIQEKELEESSLRPDLESLGLDQLDSATISSVDKESKKPNKSIAGSGSLIAEDSVVSIIKEDKKIQPKEEDIKKNVEAPPSLPKNELGEGNASKVLEVNIQPLAKDAGSEKDKIKIAQKQNDDDKKNEGKITQKIKEVIALNPANKIKELKEKVTDKITGAVLDGVKSIDNKSNDDTKKSVTNTKVVSNNKVESDLVLKAKEEKIKIKKENQIALDELREKRRARKLDDIRQKYFQKGEGGDTYEGMNRYQSISQIIPKPKILPKFISEDVPFPLLKRVKGDDNKHHPLIISNSEKIDFMFEAIAQNRIDDFNSLYSLIKDPNIKNSSGDTLLTFAVLMRRYDAVSSLLSKGANPNLTNDLGYTPLNIAIEIVDYKLAATLLDMGASVNWTDSFGKTYLMQSCMVGSLQIIDLLISNGANIDAADTNGVTALNIARRNRKDIIVKYLLKSGAKSDDEITYSNNKSSMIGDLFSKWK